MAQRGLPSQVEQLRDQVNSLKANLDTTLQMFEDLNGKMTDLAQEARQVATVLGKRPSGGGVPWGLFLTLALGAGAVWLISPGTFDTLRNFFQSQAQAVTGGTQQPQQPGG